MSHARKGIFVTGFPGFIGKRLVAHLAKVAPKSRIFVLVQPKFLEEARAYVEQLPKENRAPIELLSGDIVDLHLGLSGEEYRRLCETVTQIFHLAAISFMGAPAPRVRSVNVDGTRNIIELARDCAKLERLNHFSTCYVSGDRVGVIAEDELEFGQTFRNAYEETKFQAEKLLLKASRTLPVSIYRPSTVVGDSSTGEIDRFEGPYYLGILLVTSPLNIPLPLPGDGVAPLNVVPVDYLVQAVWKLANDPRAAGKTFHLVDPNPMSARRVYELIAQMANKRLPRITLSAKAADVMLRLPFLEKLSRPQRAAIGYVNHLAIFNCNNTLELLDGTGIRCPPLSSYLDKLVKYVRQVYQQRKDAKIEVEDPLDGPIPS
jgi:nucleoside-diphosphate-sugar epimerase